MKFCLSCQFASIFLYLCWRVLCSVLDKESVDSKVLVPSNKFRCNEPFDCSKDQERTICILDPNSNMIDITELGDNCTKTYFQFEYLD